MHPVDREYIGFTSEIAHYPSIYTLIQLNPFRTSSVSNNKKHSYTQMLTVAMLSGSDETLYDNSVCSSNELVSRFKMGDEKAFTAIVRQYQTQLIKVASMLLGDENEACDMVQETLVKVYFNRSSFRGDSSIYTWMYRILYNQCLSHLRKRKILSFMSPFSRGLNEVPGNGSDPVKKCTDHELENAVKNALTKLPMKQRMIFAMKQLEGLKHDEIAAILGISEGAVKASFYHAVNKMRALLAHYRG